MILSDYVIKHARRGACQCGLCVDAPENPKAEQPKGHTVDLTFFKVTADGGSKEEFVELVKREHSSWMDGAEHSYMEVGADMGDQGLALMTIGLGHLLKAWTAMSPDTMMPILPDNMKVKMAGMGMVTLKYHGG